MIDTRPLFRPLCRDLVALLRGLGADDWNRPTIAGHWRVRDVTAHLLDTALRRLSFQRDRSTLPSPAPGQHFVAFINALNASWVQAADRLSARVLTDLYAQASTELSSFFESLDPDDDAFFPVSWAGHSSSPQWFDIGREFTEIWHHGSQIRDAVGAGPWPDAEWLRAVLRLGMLACPPAYRAVEGREGLALVVRVTGPSGGAWTLAHHRGEWTIDERGTAHPAATVTMPDEVAWRLLFNALPTDRARALVAIEGDMALAVPLLQARSVVACPST